MLKAPLKLLLAATIALPAALISGAADAGHKKKRHHYNSHHYSGGYYYGGHHKKRHYNKHHYSYGYYPRHGYYYGGHHRRHHHSKAGTYAGLAILGLGLGYLLTRDNDNDRGNYDRYERDRDDYYRDRDDYYRDEAYRGDSGRRYSTPPTSGYQNEPVARESYAPQSFDFSQCQETREYQTTIVIDGREAQAFGTACLMEDGTWVAGPMQIQ